MRFYNLVNVFKMSKFLEGIPLWQVILASVFFLVVSILIIKAMFINKRTFGIIFVALLFVFAGLLFLFIGISDHYEEPLKTIRLVIAIITFVIVPSIVLVLISGDLNRQMDLAMQTKSIKSHEVAITSSKTKEIIAEAVFYLSAKKIGALITIEKYTSLEQYSQRAIQLNSDLSFELLTNIFIPNTPLHDGAVIIKNEKIICAGAYFNLTDNTSYEKTTGSRHRAAIGVSEISDALSIVVSEETGKVSITYGAVLLPVDSKNDLLSYLDSFSG